MKNSEDKKLELEFNFFSKSQIELNLTSVSNTIQSLPPNNKLYTDTCGFIIKTGFVFTYNLYELILPTYLPFYYYENLDLKTFYIFSNDMQRYDELNKLYKILQKFSRDKLFQYDDNGYVDMVGNKWVVY